MVVANLEMVLKMVVEVVAIHTLGFQIQDMLLVRMLVVIKRRLEIMEMQVQEVVNVDQVTGGGVTMIELI
jgi:hypothetical protein